MERQPNTGYNRGLEFFNTTFLKNRRKYLNLNFLFKLINNKIDYSPLLEKINFKINPKTLEIIIYFSYKRNTQITQ